MRIVLTTTRALAIVTACYASTAWGAAVLFRFVEHVRGAPDPHRETATAAWLVLMAMMWLVSVAIVLRGRPAR